MGPCSLLLRRPGSLDTHPPKQELFFIELLEDALPSVQGCSGFRGLRALGFRDYNPIEDLRFGGLTIGLELKTDEYAIYAPSAITSDFLCPNVQRILFPGFRSSGLVIFGLRAGYSEIPYLNPNK